MHIYMSTLIYWSKPDEPHTSGNNGMSVHLQNVRENKNMSLMSSQKFMIKNQVIDSLQMFPGVCSSCE